MAIQLFKPRERAGKACRMLRWLDCTSDADQRACRLLHRHVGGQYEHFAADEPLFHGAALYWQLSVFV